MSTQEKVSLTLSIDKEYRDRLRTMAAQQNMNDPDSLLQLHPRTGDNLRIHRFDQKAGG